MTFKEAGQFRMPFGKYKGRTLDGIASSDDGLRYLDWLLGEQNAQRRPEWGDAVEAYLSDPSIQRELEEALR